MFKFPKKTVGNDLGKVKIPEIEEDKEIEEGKQSPRN
jgi:hypothetical protein